MSTFATDTDSLDARIAQQLKTLRGERGWSLDELAARCGVSRATLSRLENAEVSPSASVLGKLCSAHGITLSWLMRQVEDDFEPMVGANVQAEWTDPETGYRRKSVSPPARTLAGEVIDCRLEPGSRLAYEAPPRPGLEHHLLLLSGNLEITVEGRIHRLAPGDCLRYQLHGASQFLTPADQPAHYLLFMV